MSRPGARKEVYGCTSPTLRDSTTDLVALPALFGGPPNYVPLDVVAEYNKRESPLDKGSAMGKYIAYQHYSRIVGTRKETYAEVVARVTNGTMEYYEEHMHRTGKLVPDSMIPFIKGDEIVRVPVKDTAINLMDGIFNFKFCSPGRGYFGGGTLVTRPISPLNGSAGGRALGAALNNCAFVSTVRDDMPAHKALIRACVFLMDMSMLGVGTGFNTKAAAKELVVYKKNSPPVMYVIPDSRQGWVKSVKYLLEQYLDPVKSECYTFDYSLIRAKGEPLRTFGGISSGPQTLMDLHKMLADLFSQTDRVTETTVVDIMNLIGVCVVSGNIRRTAEIAFGDADSEEFMDLKDYEKNPRRAAFGWTSNNSVFAKKGSDYKKIAQRIMINGEPGVAWLKNMQDYGRMCDPPNFEDHRVAGGNPCLEQSLESYEVCCLVETFPARHETLEDFLWTLQLAFFYAKMVTLVPIHWRETQEIVSRNHRIGCSMSGIAQFVAKRGLDTLREWCCAGYEMLDRFDTLISDHLGISRSIKRTSIKPSGTVSLMAGATPGMHFPIARTYIRRVRVDNSSPYLSALVAAGYHAEPDVYNTKATTVVSFPMSLEDGDEDGARIPVQSEVSIEDQMQLAAFLQRWWSDNQVSCTVSFDPETEGDKIAGLLEEYEDRLKGISFLPQPKNRIVYQQAPYEAISLERYREMIAKVRPVDFDAVPLSNPVAEKYCDSDTCTR